MTTMEIGLTKQPLLPTLKQERPAPLYHLLLRLDQTAEEGGTERLRWILNSLEFLERYFAAVATGLLRKEEDSEELSALSLNAESSKGVRRLLRYCFNRLEECGPNQAVRDLENCFFLHGKRSLPYSHARWLGLGGQGEPTWSYHQHFEDALHPENASEIDESIRKLTEVLQSWLEACGSFFDIYLEFAGLESDGWHCTLRAGDIFIELIPPLPARLIPVEAKGTAGDAPELEEPQEVLDPFATDQEVPNPFPVEPMPEPDDAELAGEAEPLAQADDVPSTEVPEHDPAPEVTVGTPGPAAKDEDQGLAPEPWPGEVVETWQPDSGPWTETPFEVDPDFEEAWNSEIIPAIEEDSGDPSPEGADQGSQAGSEQSPQVNDYSWSAAELQSFKTNLTQIYPRLDLERVPRDYFHSLTRFLSSVKSGYVLVEGRQGIGKTLLCQAMHDHLADSGLDVIPLLFSVKNQFYPDPDTFLEQLNEHLRIRPGTGRRAFEALHPKVIKNLNLRTPAEDRAQRFSAFLSELCLVNGCRIVLLLDGLDEGTLQVEKADSLFSYLPDTPPDDVYIVVTHHPGRVSPGDREILGRLRQGPSTDLHLNPGDSSYRDMMERFLSQSGQPLSEDELEMLFEKSGGRLGTARHLLDGLRCALYSGPDDLPTPSKLYESLFDRLYERVPDRYLELFLLLATSDEPVSGEELSYLGISRTDVLELLHSLPSLFHCNQRRNLGLTLAHRAIRLHLKRTFLASYAQSCAKLARRALRRLSETQVTILPVREDLERLGESVRKLLRWSIDSRDQDLLAEVCRHELLTKLRRRIFAAMEERTLYHRKVLILDTFAQALRELVERADQEEFREELAWSLSSRALSYYHLGNFQRAMVDIEAAIAQFKILVDEQGKFDLRNGLAAAHNRRSEIFRGLGEWRSALPDADLAVSIYQAVVEEDGRKDLTSLLMLARHNRALIHRALKNQEAATDDVEAALTGYLRLVERENRRPLRPQLASVHQTRAALALDRGDHQQALTSSSAALELYEILVHQENFEDLRNDLASVYNDRGAILFRARILDEAERDYASAISIRTYLVAEGRIDVRVELAKTYSNRGLCLIPRGEYASAQESFDRAVEILDRLIEEERREDLHAERAFALSCRGSLFRHQGKLEAAREDYGSAAGDYRLAVVSQGDQHLEGLAHALNSQAEVSLLAGDLELARSSSERVLEIYERNLGPERRQALSRERAIAHHNYGETLRHEGDDSGAERQFKMGIELLTFLVEKEGRPELTGELATSLLRFAQLPQRTPDERLKTVSRALAFFRAAEEEDERLANLTDEALLLRAAAYRDLRSYGSALDDVSRVVERLEEARWMDPRLGTKLVSALLERAALFGALGDLEAANLDTDRAWDVLDELQEQLSAPELELRRCHVILERVLLLVTDQTLDFDMARRHLGELDTRINRVPLENLARADYRALKRKTSQTFKNLRLAALEPTRVGDHQLAAQRLTELMEFTQQLCAGTRKLVKSALGDDELDQVTRLRTQRAWARIRAGELDAALEDFQTVADGLPPAEESSSPDILMFIAEVESGRGAVLDSLDRREEALAAYSRAVQAFALRPESALSSRRAACLTNRARLLHKMERYDEALQDVGPALEIARSGFHRSDLLARWDLKADIQRRMGDHHGSLATLREALDFGLEHDCLGAETELTFQVGVFRLSEEESERAEALSRSLQLVREKLHAKPQAWRNEVVRLFQELPYPENSDSAVRLEAEILQASVVLLKVMPPGHTPLIETLLRRASKLAGLSQERRAFARISAGYFCMATKFCFLEYQKYGHGSLDRLLRCYLLTGRSLEDSPEIPPELEGLGEGINAIAQDVILNPPEGRQEVELNNVARVWLGLPPSKVLKAGISRAALQTMRRW